MKQRYPFRKCMKHYATSLLKPLNLTVTDLSALRWMWKWSLWHRHWCSLKTMAWWPSRLQRPVSHIKCPSHVASNCQMAGNFRSSPTMMPTQFPYLVNYVNRWRRPDHPIECVRIVCQSSMGCMHACARAYVRIYRPPGVVRLGSHSELFTDHSWHLTSRAIHDTRIVIIVGIIKYHIALDKLFIWNIWSVYVKVKKYQGEELQFFVDSILQFLFSNL